MKKKSNLEILATVHNYFEDFEVIPTGCYPIDYILDGGLQQSTVYQLIGEAGVGKSTVALDISRNICAQGLHVVYIDSEGSISQELLDSLDISKYIDNYLFTYVRECTFSKVEKILDELISSDLVSLVVIDSIATLVNDGFLDTKNGISITTNNTNHISRPLTLFMNKYKAKAMEKKFSLLLVNQFRNTIDLRKGTILKEFGPKNVKYNSDVIIRINPIKSKYKFVDFTSVFKSFTEGEDLCFEVIKSNKSASNRAIPFRLIYGKGICDFLNYIYALLKLEIIQQDGSYFKFMFEGELIKGHGIEQFYREIIYKEVEFYDYFDKIKELYKSIESAK